MSKRILVVEDESGIRQLIKDALDGHNYQMMMCNNAMTARAELAKQHPDLAIIDWMMPQVTGIELIKSLRSNNETASLPIIMLTARSTEDDTIEGLDAGADDYITKPFSPRELLSRVQAALRRSTAHQTTDILRHGDVVKLMLSNPERVFSREQLLNNVWGVNSHVEERTVDVHILRLRKALRAHGVTNLIETVRGAGYRILSQ